VNRCVIYQEFLKNLDIFLDIEIVKKYCYV